MRYSISFIALTSVFAFTALSLSGCSGAGTGSTATPTPSVNPTASPTPTPSPVPATPTPNPNRSYNLTVSGSRGSVAVSVAGTPSTLTPGTALPVNTQAVGTSLLSAPLAYGDRVFLGWQLNGASFSTAPTLDALPVALNAGDTITALYGPSGSTSPLTPNYSQSDAFYWPATALPLKVFVSPTIPADYRATLIEGFDRWIAALGPAFSYQLVGNESGAQVVLTFGTAGGSTALTTVTAESSAPPRALMQASIVFDSSKLPPLTSSSNRAAMVALAAHEVGHALGINGGGVQGHSDDPNDIMFPTVSAASTTITLRDINTLMNLYNSFFATRAQATGHRAQAHGAPVTASIPCDMHW
jgi:Matrixin